MPKPTPKPTQQPTGLQGGGSIIVIIGAGTVLDVTSLLIKNFIPLIPMFLCMGFRQNTLAEYSGGYIVGIYNISD
jgi:hypothetical protein